MTKGFPVKLISVMDPRLRLIGTNPVPLSERDAARLGRAQLKRERRNGRDWRQERLSLAGVGLVDLSAKTLARKISTAMVELPAYTRVQILGSSAPACVRVRHQGEQYVIGVGDFGGDDYEFVAAALRRLEGGGGFV